MFALGGRPRTMVIPISRHRGICVRSCVKAVACVEEVVDRGVNGKEMLRRSWRLEALHLPLLSSHWLMRVFGLVDF